MAEPNKTSGSRKRKVRTPRQPKQKQGHLLVWITLIIIAIPCVIVSDLIPET